MLGEYARLSGGKKKKKKKGGAAGVFEGLHLGCDEIPP